MNLGSLKKPASMVAAAAMASVLWSCGGDAATQDSSGAAQVEEGAEILADIDLEGEARVQFVTADEGESTFALTSLARTASKATVAKLDSVDLTNLPATYAKLAAHVDPAVEKRLKQVQQRIEKTRAPKDDVFQTADVTSRFGVFANINGSSFLQEFCPLPGYQLAPKCDTQANESKSYALPGKAGSVVEAQLDPFYRGSFDMKLRNGSRTVLTFTVPRGSFGEILRVSGSGSRTVKVERSSADQIIYLAQLSPL